MAFRMAGIYRRCHPDLRGDPGANDFVSLFGVSTGQNDISPPTRSVSEFQRVFIDKWCDGVCDSRSCGTLMTDRRAMRINRCSGEYQTVASRMRRALDFHRLLELESGLSFQARIWKQHER